MSEEKNTSSKDPSGSNSKSIVYVSPEDKVVSEVNTFLLTATNVKPIQKPSNKVAKLGLSLPKNETNEKSKGIQYDSDGDFVLQRKEHSTIYETNILIEYENATSIGLVGLQVWRGAFLLGDFIIHFNQKYFKNKTILEVGTGTGLGSIVASHYAAKVIATDLNDSSILDLIGANLSHNKNFIKCEIIVKPLDFMDLNWTSEIEELVKESDVILAADVVYHVDITNAFIQTLKKILSCGSKAKDVFIAMEKRYVFTISDLDTMSPMYSHFMEEMDSQLGLSPGCLPIPLGTNKGQASMSFISKEFPQYFNYDRTKELVFIHLQYNV